MLEVSCRICEHCKRIVVHNDNHCTLSETLVKDRGNKRELWILERYFCNLDCIKNWLGVGEEK